MPAIMYETGPDEAFLVGTDAELRALASGILRALESPGEPADHFGVHCLSTQQPQTEVWGDVRVDGLLVTRTTAEKRQLINSIRKNNGEQPVAAEGWPR